MSIDKVDLGTSLNFAVFANRAVRTRLRSVIQGDLGTYPGDEIEGFPPGVVIGTIHRDDRVARQAQFDLARAYNDLNSRTPTHIIRNDLSRLKLRAGVYQTNNRGPLTMSPGILTLDGQNNPDATFIFQTNDLQIQGSTRVRLIRGANPNNVFFVSTNNILIDVSGSLVGNLVALKNIFLNVQTNVFGRVLSRNGFAQFDQTRIIRPALPPPPPVPCLAGNTQITLVNGVTKSIDQIQRGDLVYGDETGSIINQVAQVTKTVLSPDSFISLVKVQKDTWGPDLPNQELIITGAHPVVLDQIRRPVCSFRKFPGVTWFTQTKKTSELIPINDQGLYVIYDLVFDHDANYVANGVVVQAHSPYHPINPLPRDLYFNLKNYNSKREPHGLNHTYPYDKTVIKPEEFKLI